MSRMRASLVAVLVTLTSLVALSPTPAPAYADECYSWGRTLSSGATGDDVAQLQVRVAGWAGYGVNMAIDGSYGAATVQQNLLRAMWRAEALRHRLGDRQLTVTSGFRSTWSARRPPCARSRAARATRASAASTSRATPTTTTTCTWTSGPAGRGAPPSCGI